MIHKYPKNNIIYFLIIVILLTTYISEYFLLQPVKEGFNFGFIFEVIGMLVKFLMNIGNFLLGIFQLIMWGFQMIGVIPQIVIWFVMYIISWITALANLPQCFLWYSLQTIGWIIYLPIRVLWAILNMILYILGKFVDVDIPFDFQEADYWLWCRLDDIDKMIHASTGGHIVHYPDSVIDKCYPVSKNPFPELPAFPTEAIDNLSSAI